MEYEVIIVGGGPAGLFAGIHLGASGKKVLLLEKNNMAGKKLLLSGSGQCNITHDGDIKEFANYYGDQYKYIKTALQNFTNSDTVEFFEARGIKLESLDNGKIFPKIRSAKNILDLLVQECSSNNVEIRYNETVSGIESYEDSYLVKTHKQSFKAKYVVVATGGITYPKTGSTGDGYKIAYDLGHKIVKPLPALTPVEIEDFPFSDLAGISIEGLPITIWRNGKKEKEFTGDVLFTHKGLSGPGILNNSRWMRSGDTLSLNLIRSLNSKKFNKVLLQEINNNGKDFIKTILRKYDLPKRLVDAILTYTNISGETQCGQIDKEARGLIVKTLTGLSLAISQIGGLHIAMVTSGGINMKQVNPTTMESRLNQNLYFIGELLDIDGDTGGYNIQAAFSTGKLCADCIKEKEIK